MPLRDFEQATAEPVMAAARALGRALQASGGVAAQKRAS